MFLLRFFLLAPGWEGLELLLSQLASLGAHVRTLEVEPHLFVVL